MQMTGESGQAALSFFLFFVLCTLLAGGVYMLDQMNLIDVRELVYPYVEKVPLVGDYVVPSPISQLEKKQSMLRQMRQKIEQRENELETRQKQIKQRQEQLRQRENNIDQQEEELVEREQALAERRREFEDEESRYSYLANLYSNMPPEEAAARLSGIEQDRVIIEIFRRMENRNTSIILSNMDNQRAASITRKLAHYPGQNN